MKKKEILSNQEKRTMKIVLMRLLGEELNKILQNKLIISSFPKIEKFAEEYVHEVEKNILANSAHAKIRKDLSTKKGKK